MDSIIITKGTGKYKLSRDPYCFVLEKYRRNTNSWDNAGYYQTIESVVRKLVRLSIMEHADLKNIVDIVDATCKAVAAQVEKALK